MFLWKPAMPCHTRTTCQRIPTYFPRRRWTSPGDHVFPALPRYRALAGAAVSLWSILGRKTVSSASPRPDDCLAPSRSRPGTQGASRVGDVYTGSVCRRYPFALPTPPGASRLRGQPSPLPCGRRPPDRTWRPVRFSIRSARKEPLLGISFMQFSVSDFQICQ